MKTTIYCRLTNKGVHSLYLLVGTEEFFLFSQAYRKGVEEYYGRGGVHIDESMKHSRAHNNSAITKTMDKIPMYIRYIEKEYDIKVLEKTKKHSMQRHSAVCRRKIIDAEPAGRLAVCAGSDWKIF
ncbi:MAG: hypothetical protein IKT09_02130 [Synergistes sp.]|nr:hypothetical protein [Synergistes sp.]